MGFVVSLTPCLHCPWLSRNSYKQEIKTKNKKQKSKKKQKTNKPTNPKQEKKTKNKQKKSNKKNLALACLNCEIPSDGVGLCAICQMPVIFLISKYILFR